MPLFQTNMNPSDTPFASESSLQAKPPVGKQRYPTSIKILTWITTVIFSCLATLFLTDWWNEARGSLDIAKLELRPLGNPTDSLALGPELAQRTENHHYFVTVASDTTFKEVADAIEDASKKTDIAKRVVARIDALLGLLNTQSMALSLDARRKQFLERLTDNSEEYGFFEKNAKALVITYVTNLPAKYFTHPLEAKNLIVHFEDTRGYRLGEESEDEIAKRFQSASNDVNAYERGRLEAQKTNSLRRLFIYYEPDVLIGFLKACRAWVEGDRVGAETLVSALRAKVEETRKQYLYVSVLASNSGTTPLALEPLGVLVLHIPNPNKESAQTLSIRLLGDGDFADASVVEKGKPKLLTFVSAKPLSLIIDENHESLGGDEWTTTNFPLEHSRFMQLWQAKAVGLEGSVKIARVSVDSKQNTFCESDRRPIGLNTKERIYELLQK